MNQENANPSSVNVEALSGDVDKRRQSLQLRAVLTVISGDPELARIGIRFVDLVNESINWDELLNWEWSSGQRIALEWARLLWTDRYREKELNIFDDAFSMDKNLRAAVLRALALRWSV